MCYKVVTTATDFNPADLDCKNDGGNLMIIKNSIEKTIANLFNSNYFSSNLGYWVNIFKYPK